MGLKNARLEIVEKLQKLALKNINVICARVIVNHKKQEKNYLKLDYSVKEFNEFCDKFEFNYDNYSGKEYVSGEIWLSDGSWLERTYVDDMQIWKLYKTPEIPDFLKS